MKTFLGPGLAIVLVLAVGVLYFLSPSLQDAGAQRDRLVAEHIEKAERLLTAYNRDLDRLGELQRDAARWMAPAGSNGEGADAELLTTERLTKVAEAKPEALNEIGTSIRQAFAEPVLRNVTSTLESKYQAQIPAGERSGAQQEASAVTAGVNTSPAGLPGMNAAFANMVSENQARLQAAKNEVTQALGVSVGNASGRDHAGANRMAGIVHYQLAADAQRSARRIRLGAVAPRREIGRLAVLHAEAARQATFLAEQKLADVLDEVTRNRDALRAGRQTTAGQLRELRTRITELEGQLQDAKTRARQAADKLLELDNQGYAYDDEKAFAAFRQSYLELGRQWRDALHQAEAIEFGTLLNARIADPDNYLTDTYEPEPGKQITESLGIRNHMKSVDILEAQDKTREAQIKELDEEIAAIQARAQGLEAAQAKATQRAGEQLAKLSAQVSKVVTEAEAAIAPEDEAINLAKQSARFFTTAARLTQSRADDSGRIAGQAPADAPNERLNEIAKDKDFAAHLSASAADAYLLAASVQYQRIVALERNRSALALAAQAGVADVDVAGQADQIAAARTDGLEAVENAVSELQKAGQTLDRAERETSAGAGRWAITANLATAHYLGSQLATDEPPAPTTMPDGEAVAAKPHKPPAEYRNQAVDLLRALTEAQPDNPLLSHVDNIPAPAPQ